MTHYLLVANWKMNGLASDIDEAINIADGCTHPNHQVVICPPAPLLSRMSVILDNENVHLGGQDCHSSESGAHTGDHSAQMLADAGANYVILGHSERRSFHQESSELINLKAQAAWQAGLTVIICVGESESERLEGRETEIVGDQLQASIPIPVPESGKGKLVVAYEPVWAIGTGRVAERAEIASMHQYIFQFCQRHLASEDSVPILYGGSVNATNAVDIFSVPHVNGGLVGGASLKAKTFNPIFHSLPN